MCPSGKLTVSMPQSTGQEPLYYNHLPTEPTRGRGAKEYHSMPATIWMCAMMPLSPLWFRSQLLRLFSYGDIRLDADQMAQNGKIKATVTIKTQAAVTAMKSHNFISDRVASITPVKGTERLPAHPSHQPEKARTSRLM